MTSNMRKPLAPPPVPGSVGARQSIIGRPLVWIINALGLTNPQVPMALSPEPVHSVLDVAQDGWALASYMTIPGKTFQLPGSTVGDLLVPDPLNTQAVVAMDLWMSGGTTGLPVQICLYQGAPTFAQSGALNVAVAQGIVQPETVTEVLYITWAALMGRGDAVLVVPPNFGLGIRFQDIEVGAALKVDMTVATIPGGYQVRT